MKLIVISLCAALAVTSAVKGDNITVKGSDTMVILGQKWAESYMRKRTDTTVQVTGGGSGTGIAALLNGTTDICEASRPMKLAELADFVKKYRAKPHEYKMCLDALSVYVNKENKLEKLSFPQLEAIFTGKITNWKELGGPDAPISLYGRENSSGTYELFKDQVLNKKDFASTTKTMPGTAAVIQAVANDKTGIGYGGIAYGEGVKALKISVTEDSEAIEPSEATVLSKTYPIARYLYNYVSPENDSGSVAEFITWCKSPEGQAIVKEVGYFPLPK
jgi:phosphate transport system substrate-binding protein